MTYLEPINGAAVDKGGEFSQSGAEGVPDGAHGEHNMELVSDSLDEEVKQRYRRAISLLSLVSLSGRRQRRQF